jgi:4-diphosphocytidyl-2-C-methyl-D-erythritol kinase
VRRVARAKVNLYLQVKGRRPDGYHDLDSLVVFPDFGDVVELRRAERWSVDVEGPFASLLAAVPAHENIAVKAATALMRAAGRDQPHKIRIDKRIPVGAGLGGGSADAAAVLHLLNEHLHLGFDLLELQHLGLALGADVPVCLHGSSAFFAGVGDIVEPAAMPPLDLVLVWPGKSLSTAAVFRAAHVRGDRARPRIEGDAARVLEALHAIDNDLAAPAEALLPEVGAVLAALRSEPECRLARMSGSGSSCFGLLPSASAAQVAARRLRSAHPSWWITAASTTAAQ